VAVAFGTLLIGGRPARADFDLNGNWETGAVVLNFNVLCNIDITQVTTSLTLTGTCDLAGAINLTGTIDPMTGAFTLSGSAAAICTMPGSLTITAQASDNANFSGTLDCNGLTGGLVGSRCGNGQLDPGEQCDLGPNNNGVVGSCCTSTCQFAPNTSTCRQAFVCDPAEFCTGSSATCPPDLKAPDGTTCSSGNSCESNETCSSGICTNGTPIVAGTTCDVSTECADFQCDGLGTCQEIDNNNPCDDGDACTTNDACNNGFCNGGPPLDCGLCQTCDSVLGCQPVIEQVCTAPSAPAALLTIREGATPADAQVKWKWKNGGQITVQDFGDPRTTTTYALCVYDQDPAAPSGLRLLVDANVLPNNTNWSPNAKGYKYQDSTLAADGMQLIMLKSGAAGKAKITLRAKGSNLNVANLPATAPVTVQLKTNNGICWTANYPTLQKNNPVSVHGTGGP
jgi:hypothetical protein